jgi:hypothetical protein
MKRLIILLLSMLLLPVVFSEISSPDKTQVQNQVMLIANSINSNNIDDILNLVSDNARTGLKQEIENNLRGQTIQFQQTIVSYQDLGNNKMKVKCVYSARGSTGWYIDGISNYYTFEKTGNSWLLVDTDFHQKLGSGYVLKTVGKIFTVVSAIGVPIVILLCAFWLWMLIDAIKREFENKVLWIILIILLGFLGAILYFFIVRRKSQKINMVGEYV